MHQAMSRFGRAIAFLNSTGLDRTVRRYVANSKTRLVAAGSLNHGSNERGQN